MKKPIGRQDQYIAAFGGLQEIYFNSDGSVSGHPVLCDLQQRDQLPRRLMLFYTGLHREAGSVLTEAKQIMKKGTEGRATIDGLVALADGVRQVLTSGRISRLGKLLDASWTIKKQMASSVANPHLDDLYSRAVNAGAEGGKVSGAGGGGCLLLCVRPSARSRVRTAMARAGLRELPVGLEIEGSRIIHYSD